ncbi:MAG: GNAT family N-acetyltransferase [Xanthobacter sp.]
MTDIVLESVEDVSARETLLDLCMGEGRWAKASERLREGRLPAEGLAFAAHGLDGRLAGTVRLWHVSAGAARPALLLGPLAVHPWFRAGGLGGALMRKAIETAGQLGHEAILLVGDPAYYQRFGFTAAHTATLWMPGAYEQHRLLGLELKADALRGARGLISPTGVEVARPSLADLIAREFRLSA